MVPQREVAIAPFHIGAGTLEHLRECGCVRLELLLLHQTALPERSTGRKQWGTEALGPCAKRLTLCHCPRRGHTLEVVRGNETHIHRKGLRWGQRQLLDLLAYIP